MFNELFAIQNVKISNSQENVAKEQCTAVATTIICYGTHIRENLEHFYGS